MGNFVAESENKRMAMPTFQEIMLPILKFVAQESESSIKDLIEQVEQSFSLTDEEKQQRVPSGTQRTIYNRVTWAISHMKKAGLLEPRGKRGCYQITELT